MFFTLYEHLVVHSLWLLPLVLIISILLFIIIISTRRHGVRVFFMCCWKFKCLFCVTFYLKLAKYTGCCMYTFSTSIPTFNVFHIIVNSYQGINIIILCYSLVTLFISYFIHSVPISLFYSYFFIISYFYAGVFKRYII